MGHLFGQQSVVTPLLTLLRLFIVSLVAPTWSTAMSTAEFSGSEELSKSKTNPSSSDASEAAANIQPGVSTISVHAGEARQKPLNSITDPIAMASTFTFENTQSIIDFIEKSEERGEYGRYGVPGEQVVEQKLAALEGAESGVLFSSGMAALVGLFNAKLSAGDEIIFFDECYHRSREY